MTTLTRKTCAIYARVSTAEQSLERQVQDLTRYAERSGYRVIGIFLESASGKKDNRPERAKVMRLAKLREIDKILVTELSRWGRSTADVINSVDVLHHYKVSLLCLSGLSFDLDNPADKLMLRMVAAFAEFERDLISDRTKSALALKKAQGIKLGRPGGRSKKLAAKKKQILKLRGEGYSLRAIAKWTDLSYGSVQKIVAEQKNKSFPRASIEEA